MTTLLTIPGCTAYHIPAPNVAPVPLAKGDLTLSLLPADPPRRAEEQLAISVGATSFLLAPNSPVRKTKSNLQHASFIFTPAPPAEGQGIGTVRIDMKDSSDPDAWEDTERKCSALEAELRTRELWEDTELFVNDENETGGPVVGPKKGWGESIAGSIFGGVSALASKITGRSNSQEVLPTTRSQYDGGYPPSPSVETPPAASATPESEREQKPQHFKALAEHSWAQATIAARGIGEAAAAVGGAVGQTAKNAFDGIKDGVSERDEIPAGAAPAVPAKDTKAAVNTDKPVPPAPKETAGASAKDEVDALDEPVVSGAIKNVKINEVVPVTPDERDTRVVDIKPEAVTAALKAEPKEEEAEPAASKPADKKEEVKINEVEPIEPDEPDTQVEEIKPEAVADAVKDLKIDDKAAEKEEIKEEAAAIVAASDAEVKAEEQDAKVEEEAATSGAKDSTETEEKAKPAAGGAGGKKKNKKNKKKN